MIATITGLPPLRWVGVRSYGIYLWHWPVIALGAALAGAGATSAWLWLLETGITIALAAASWRFVEAPILRDGLRPTVRRWRRVLAEAARRQAGTAARAVPVAMAAAAAIVFLVASYGVIRPPAPPAPTGLLRQVANGERVSSASQSAKPAASRSAVPGPGSSPAGCRREAPRVSGDQVIAVGDSVMLASAAALEAALPGAYIDAQVDRQMQDGLTVLQDLAAAGMLRQVIVVGLGTNGTVTAGQIRQLRRIIGPARELVLVNTFGPQPWEREVNAVLAAARHARHTELADWGRAIAARPGLLWPDGVHPQPDGGRLYARVVLAAVRAGQPSACPPPCRISVRVTC